MCKSDYLVPSASGRSSNLTFGICHSAQQEAVSMGVNFKQSKTLPLKVDASWSKNVQSTSNSSPGSLAFQSSPRGPSPSLPIWPGSIPFKGGEKREWEYRSLCNPHSSDQAPQETCCTAELEGQLLRRTTEEMHESLSSYLTRWSSEIANLRTAFREEVFRTLEQFRLELNRTLCNRPVDSSKQNVRTNCSEVAADLFPKFRLMIEQFIVGQGDLTLDISIPIDNLLMQLLIDFSCQSSLDNGVNTLEAFNEEIRCHKYCQARLNLILDSLMSNTNPSILTVRRRRRRQANHRSLGNSKTTTTTLPERTTITTGSGDYQTTGPMSVDQYRLLYSPELLFTIRLNRILMQALELAESLIDGLKDFNPAQGLCVQKLMRMHHCALCAGETLIRPCPELCSTVVASCLQPLSELHSPWKRFTDTIKIASDTFLDKPQLSMMVQFRQLPRRLTAYFRHLLKTHKDWLQPQCAGTEKLLEILGNDSPEDLMDDTETISKDAASLKSYRELLDHLKRKMDQMVDLWTRISSTMCTESPHLISSSKNPEECWNGTAKGRFHFERCEFCQQPKSPVAEEGAQGQDALVPPSRRQRTSHIPIKPELVVPEFDNLALRPFSGVPYMLASPLWNTLLDQEKEMAARRANELLVRASRDLQWSADSFLGEMQAYGSIHGRMNGQNGGYTPSTPDGERHGMPESWTAFQPNNADAQKRPGVRRTPEEMGESVGLLAYGSMLGWGVNDFGRAEQPLGDTDSSGQSEKRDREGPIGANKKPGIAQEDTSNVSQIRGSEGPNNGSDLDESVGDSSGFQPAWSIYGWSQPNLVPQSGTSVSSSSSATEASSTPNTYSSMEGSGMMGNQGNVPSFMEYADYPHLNSFNSFLNANQPGVEPENKQGLGPVVDDEDFAPTGSAVPPSPVQKTFMDQNQNLKNISTIRFDVTDTGNENRIKGAEGKYTPTNGTYNSQKSTVSFFWLSSTSVITVISICFY